MGPENSLTAAKLTLKALARAGPMGGKTHTNEAVKAKLWELYEELFSHHGYGELRIEMQMLRPDRKEVILHCGKQYRFVVEYPGPSGERR